MENNAARKLKQVPVGYLMVGVDPHKKKHVAVTMTQDFLVQGKFILQQHLLTLAAIQPRYSPSPKMPRI